MQPDHQSHHVQDQGLVVRDRAWIRNRVQELRRARGVSPKELAEAVAMNARTIILVDLEDYEPGLSEAYALADFFGLPVEEVFWREYPGEIPHPARERLVLEVPNPTIANRYSRLRVLNWLLDTFHTRSRDMLLGLLRSFEDEEEAVSDLQALSDAALIAEDPPISPTPSLFDRLLSRETETRVRYHLTPAGRQAIMQAYAHGAGEYERARHRSNIELRYLRVLGQYPDPIPIQKLEGAIGFTGKRVTWETRHLQAHGLVSIEEEENKRRVALTDKGRKRYAARHANPPSF